MISSAMPSEILVCPSRSCCERAAPPPISADTPVCIGLGIVVPGGLNGLRETGCGVVTARDIVDMALKQRALDVSGHPRSSRIASAPP